MKLVPTTIDEFEAKFRAVIEKKGFHGTHAEYGQLRAIERLSPDQRTFLDKLASEYATASCYDRAYTRDMMHSFRLDFLIND